MPTLLHRRKSGVRNGSERGSRRFINNDRGATVVEFAIVAPLFIALTFSILEAGFYFFSTGAVDAANAKAARLIRTGQAGSGQQAQRAFFDEVCNVVRFIGDCRERLTVEVTNFSSFAELAASASDPVCRDARPADVNRIPFEPGAQREIVRVRVCFLYRGFSPGIGLNLENAEDGSQKIVSTTIFRNEPF